MSTIIKRLSQNGTEFVPITLAEAVVVNVPNVSPEITTLDKVLGKNQELINKLNLQLELKLSKLTAGKGIQINYEPSSGRTTISTNVESKIFKPVTSLPELLDADPSTIYLVPSKTPDSSGGDLFSEFIVVNNLESESPPRRLWERLGTISAKTDLSNYLSKLEGVIATAVTDSTRLYIIKVNYEIPTTLYDSAISLDSDKIIG